MSARLHSTPCLPYAALLYALAEQCEAADTTAVASSYLAIEIGIVIVVATVIAVLVKKNQKAAPKKPEPAAAPEAAPEAAKAAPAHEAKTTAPQAAPKPPSSAPAPVGANIRQGVAKLERLPSMPLIAQKLLQLKLDSPTGQREMLMLIEQDPQMLARILGQANSAGISASRKVLSVKDAALLLGYTRVQMTAVSIALMAVMSQKPLGEFDMEELWRHSFYIASGMDALARFMPADRRAPGDTVFLAGMLHDIGYLALAFLSPELSDKLHNHISAEPQRASLEIERELLDMTHDELGAELARHWNLPEELIDTLRHHHTPEAATSPTAQTLTRMISLAERLLPAAGLIERTPQEINAAEWEALGLNAEQAEEYKTQIIQQAARSLEMASAAV